MPAGPLYPVNGFDTSRLKDATLVIPAVSLGNVPQLTADLLVSSLGLARAGFVGLGDTVAPLAGAGEGGIVTGGLELYGADGNDLFVLMQRAPTFKGKKEEHVALIASLVTQYGVGRTLVLASLDAANQDDAQLLTPHQAILPPSPSPLLARLSQIPPLRLALESSVASNPSTKYPPFLPGAGLTRRLLAELPQPSGALAAWVVEGDNRGDAHALATVALGVLEVDVNGLVEPASWAGLFGPSEWSGGAGMNAEIYG